MNLLDNWLIQSIVANAVCFTLGKICIYFYKNIKLQNKTIIKKPVSKYSTKILRKQFYISFVVIIVSIILLFFFIGQNLLTIICSTSIFWSILLIIFAFECSLECFTDFPTKRS